MLELIQINTGVQLKHISHMLFEETDDRNDTCR
jgi:hypothetical protein